MRHQIVTDLEQSIGSVFRSTLPGYEKEPDDVCVN